MRTPMPKFNSPPVIALACLLPLAVACTTAPPAGGLPVLTFEQVKKVPLNVGKIEIVDNYMSPMKAPYAEHLFRQTPEDAAKLLFSRQLQAAGSENNLRIIIEKAEVIAEDLPKEPGVVDLISPDNSRLYKGKLVVRFEAFRPDAPDIIIGHADLTVTRNKTVPGHFSLAERDQAFFDMVEAMMNDLSQGLQTTVADTFGTR